MSIGTDRDAAFVGKVDRQADTKRATVDFVDKQADEQVVTGVVMVPRSVDRQGDWETPETIETFAEQFQSLYDTGSADGGIMHAAWPSEWMELAYNGIVGKSFPDDAPIPDDIDDMSGCIDWAEEQEEIDDPAAFCQSYNVEEDIQDDAWAQTWRINDDGLWGLIEDDIIQGFSIGARDVTWEGPMDQADLPEGVGVPDDYPDDQPVYELVDGVIREVSAVDTPAVPEAMIMAKEDSEKALDEYLGNRDAFIEEAMERGHDESAAERLWNVLTEAAETDGAGNPGQKSFFARIGKAVHRAFGSDDATGAESQTRMDKEGQTLSRKNRESLFATIDASLDILQDANVDHGMQRFTDREDYAFDLSEHTARSWPAPDDTDASAPTDDTDINTDTTMSDTDTDDDPSKEADGDPFEDAPQWAADLKDTVEANTEQLEDLKADDTDGDDEKDADAGTEGDDEAPEWAKALADQVESNAEAVEAIGKQSGFSTQVRDNGDGEEAEEKGLDKVAELLEG